MAQVSKTAVSKLIKEKRGEDDLDDESKKRSRDDFKKQKELEEQRKLGNAPAAVDESGKDINPHIPQYISEAPWYLDPEGPTLRHQRQQEEKVQTYSGIDEWYKKGVNKQSIATKYRKGACENCGALTHKKRDCVERPRKVGAKYTGSNLAPDEFLQPKLNLTYDGKRDRWNGYENIAHKETIEEYEKLEEVKRELKKERVKEGFLNPDVEDDGAPSSDEDEDKYVDKMDMPGTKVDAAERYTVRNLRIREDTAKYLRNLDISSAYYDPKTRSMRKNPYEGSGQKDEEVEYAGDNYVRISGDTVNHAQSQMFAWDAGRKGLEVHALAEPTKLEALKKEYVQKKDTLKDEAKNQILEKYGGEEHLNSAPPRELIFAQSEHYVEYSRTGEVLKGEEASMTKTKYEEDIHPGNHSSVWGSFWHEGKWGFKCCYSFVKVSYCTGAAGRTNFESILAVATSAFEKKSHSIEGNSADIEESSSEKKKHKKKKKKKDKKRRDDEDEDFETKVRKAMEKQQREEAEMEKVTDDRKRSYNSVSKNSDKELSEAEIEAYKRRRVREDDPMAGFL